MTRALLVVLAACAPTTYLVQAPSGSPLAGKRLVEHELGGAAALHHAVRIVGTPFELVDVPRSSPDFALLEAGRIAAVASPRGDALALTIDGGKTYRYIAISGDLAHGVPCTHVLAASPDELWRRWPDRHAFALDVLAHPADHLSAVDNDVARSQPELYPLREIAAADGDLEVVHAALRAYLLDDPRWAREIELARDSPRWLAPFDGVEVALLVETLHGNSADLRGRAAIALGYTGSPAASNAIAHQILATRDEASSLACELRTKLSWSLVRLVRARLAAHQRAPDPVVHDALIALVAHESCGQYRGEIGLDAIYGLVAVGDSETLRQLAGDATAVPFSDHYPRAIWSDPAGAIDLAHLARGALDFMAKPQ